VNKYKLTYSLAYIPNKCGKARNSWIKLVTKPSASDVFNKLFSFIPHVHEKICSLGASF